MNLFSRIIDKNDRNYSDDNKEFKLKGTMLNRLGIKLYQYYNIVNDQIVTKNYYLTPWNVFSEIRTIKNKHIFNEQDKKQKYKTSDYNFNYDGMYEINIHDSDEFKAIKDNNVTRSFKIIVPLEKNIYKINRNFVFKEMPLNMKIVMYCENFSHNRSWHLFGFYDADKIIYDLVESFAEHSHYYITIYDNLHKEKKSKYSLEDIKNTKYEDYDNFENSCDENDDEGPKSYYDDHDYDNIEKYIYKAYLELADDGFFGDMNKDRTVLFNVSRAFYDLLKNDDEKYNHHMEKEYKYSCNMIKKELADIELKKLKISDSDWDFIYKYNMDDEYYALKKNYKPSVCENIFFKPYTSLSFEYLRTNDDSNNNSNGDSNSNRTNNVS